MKAKRIRAAILAMLLSASMIASSMSGAVFAAEGENETVAETVQTELEPSEPEKETEEALEVPEEQPSEESENTTEEEPEVTEEEPSEEAEEIPEEEAVPEEEVTPKEEIETETPVTTEKEEETKDEELPEADDEEIVLAEAAEPRDIWFGTAGARDQRCTLTMETDFVERKYQRVIPDASVYPNSDIAPAFFTTKTGENVIKIVLKTASNTVPMCSVFISDGKGGYSKNVSLTAKLDEGKTMTANAWNTVYIDMTDTLAAAEFPYLWAFMFRPYAGEKVSDHLSDYVEIGYMGLFGSLEDAKAHVSEFEGKPTLKDITVGGKTIPGFDASGTEFEYDLNGAYETGAVKIHCVGNMDGMSLAGTAYDKTTGSSEVFIHKKGDTTERLCTLKLVNGAKKTDIEPLAMKASILQPSGNRCTGGDAVDEFGRTKTVINPVWQYYDSEEKSDKWAEGSVAPGGGVDALNDAKYTTIKLVYRSTSKKVPSISLFSDGFADKCSGKVVESVTADPGNWQTIIYENAMDVPMRWFMVNFADSNTETVDGTKKVISDVFEIGYVGAFGSVIDAMDYESDFEGEFTVSDVLVGGKSIGNVTTHEYDLAGLSDIPALTVKATGNTNSVKIKNGTLGTDGTAVSTVKKGSDTVVTVNFKNGSTDFIITGILVDGKAIADFDRATTTYNVALGYGASTPVVTYSHSGIESETAEVVTTNVDGGYKTEIRDGGTVLYTINFTVATEKPALINTLYKLNTEKKVTVGYLGGSVTAGTGSTSAEKTSWRALTREWFKSAFPNATVTEINDAIGGTGVIFGLFRAENRYFSKNGGKAPDINFIEMAINDAYDGVSGNTQYVYIESLVRKIYASNPKADIVFVITGDSGRSAAEVASSTPVFGQAYTDLAAYYNIPIVYPFRELAIKIAGENGGNAVTSSDNAHWKKYFTDGVHPIDAGYAEYANTIVNYLEPNLPASYAPEASEYTEKVLPTETYCVKNGKGDLLVDAYGFEPTKITNTEYFGGYAVEPDGSYKPLRSRKAEQVITLKFKAGGIGIWTWSYGTNNGKNGTNITYSVDGGERKVQNIYRSYPNHRSYMLAEGLDPTKEHTIRIFHNDADAVLDIKYFYLWDFAEGTSYDDVTMSAVPYLDTTSDEVKAVTKAEVSVGETVKDLGFSFDKHEYTIPMTLVNGEYVIALAADAKTYPTLNVTLPDGYVGYTLTQAGEGGTGTNKAVLSLDNVGVYTFEFVLEGVPENYTVTSATTAFGSDAKITFAEATTQKLEIKRDEETEYTLYDAGITEITGLSAGLYQMRYTDGENAGAEIDVRVWETYPENANVYYVTDGGTGDGKSPETPATTGNGFGNIVSNFKSAFSSYNDRTKVNYIVFLGSVTTNKNATETDFAGFTDTVFTSEYGSMFYLKAHLKHKKINTDIGASMGRVTWKNIDVTIGNPENSSIDGEIYYTAYGQPITFDNFSIVGFAKNASGVSRKKGMHINYFDDGAGTHTLTNPQPIIVNSPKLKIEGVRTSAYCGSGMNVTSDVYFVIEDATIANFGMGPHGNDNNASTTTGNVYGTINGGTIGTVYVGGINGGDKRILNGSALVVVNGGTIGRIKATAGNPTNDNALIVNNGLTYTVETANIDYYLKSGINGSANAVLDSETRTITKFTFETEKRYVYIDAGTANEKKLEVVDGKAEIAASELGAGTHTADYQNNDFVVKYDGGANKYATVPEQAEYANGDTIEAIADPTFANGEKYTFLGWSADGTNLVTLPYTVTASATLTALWGVDNTVIYVSDKSGHPDGGDDPSYPLGGAQASGTMFTAKKLDFVQVNTATNPVTVKSTDVVDGYTFGNQSVNTSAYVNANGKLTNGGTLIVTDEMIVTGSGAAGTVTVKGLDENSVAYIVGGTDMPKGDRFYTDIKVLNVYTDEAVIRTGNYNVTFTDTAYVGNGYYEIDGKPYYYLNGRSYGTNVYFLYVTGSGYTAGGSGFISAFVPYETSAPYYGYKKASTTPRIGVYNYNGNIAIGSSSATVGAGNVGMLLTGANYNNGYAKLVNAVNGDRTVMVNGGYVETVAAGHMAYYNGIGRMIINGGTVANLLLGANQSNNTANGQSATFGLIYATVNDGKVSNASMTGTLQPGVPTTARETYSTAFTENIKSYKRMGVSVLEVNGGTVGKVTSSNANADVLTRVIINNGGTFTTAPTASVYDYYAESDGTVVIGAEVDTSATYTYENDSVVYPLGEKYSFTGFEVAVNGTKTRDKLKITKVTTDGETELATVDLVDGKATVAKETLGGTGSYKFSAYNSAGDEAELPVKIYIDRKSSATPSAQSYMRIAIYETGTNNLVKSVVVEGADTKTQTETDADGKVKYYIEANALLGTIPAAGNYDVKIEKNGYLASTIFKNVSAAYLGGVTDISVSELIPGDIKDSFDAVCGNGRVDIDDFIRVIRGFDPNASENLQAAVDINEDGHVTIEDLVLIKNNFGKTSD